MGFQIKELLLSEGGSPFAKWFDGLDAISAAEVRLALGRMEPGNLSGVEWFRGIGEYKVAWGPGLRIYFGCCTLGRLQAPQGAYAERQVTMALTREFEETVAARVQNDPAFSQALLDEAIMLFVNGEAEAAKLILRDLVNATVGFEALAQEIHKPSKSLHRMLSNSGNPTMSNISAVFAAIKRTLNVEVHTRVVTA